MVRDFAGEELSGGKQSGGDALGSRRKRRGGSGVAVLRAREGERSSLRVLALSGEGRRGVVVRTVEVAQTGTGRRVASEGGERGGDRAEERANGLDAPRVVSRRGDRGRRLQTEAREIARDMQ